MPKRNDRLRRQREERGWSQEYVAEKLGIDPQTVRRWEQGVYQPRGHHRIEVLNLFEMSAEELGLEAPSRSASPEKDAHDAVQPDAMLPGEKAQQNFNGLKPDQPWNVPFPRNRYFTGRTLLLDGLHRRLTKKKAVALSQAISGLGGIGKTATAVEYAYRFAGEYEAVLWVNADSETLVSSFAGLASVLDLPEQHERDQPLAIEAVKRWLQTHGGWLLIFDNADDLKMVFNYLPGGTRGAVLLTTRAQATGSYIENIEMGKMSRKDGAHFLLRRKYGNKTQLLSSADRQEREEARQICECLEGLPLALDQAAAYLEETRCPLSAYLDAYKTHRKDLLTRRGETGSEHPESVVMTWRLALNKMEQANPAAVELLRFCAFLHPAIPETILITGADALGPVLQRTAADTFAWNETIAELLKYSLVKRDDKEKILRMHRLVQAVIMDDMPQEAAQVWAERALRVVSAAFPKVEHKTWQQCEQLLPHVRQVTQHLERLGMMNEEAGRLVSEAASYLRDRSRYTEAEALLLHTLDVLERQFGPEHPCVISPLNSLARLYMYLGKYEQAKAICQRVFQIHEQHPERKRQDIPLHILATIHISLGNYKQAEPLLLQALQIRQQELGEAHPDVATTLNNLAVLYTYQGKYEQAVAAYQQARPIYEQQREYLHLVYVLSNLGELYIEQGRAPASEPLFQQARKICEQQLEPGHHGVAVPLNGLARCYFEQGNYPESEALYRQALQILEEGLEPGHPDIAGPLHGLANLYREQSSYAQAERFYERALHILELAVGREHPETARVIHDLARLREKQGERDEARSLYTRALAIREQALGTHHPKTTETRRCLVALLRAMGRDEEADQLEA